MTQPVQTKTKWPESPLPTSLDSVTPFKWYSGYAYLIDASSTNKKFQDSTPSYKKLVDDNKKATADGGTVKDIPTNYEVLYPLF